MRAIPGSPTAFLDWLQTSGTLTVDPDAVTPEGIFARRRDFGRFMQAQLAPHLDSGSIRHIRQAVRVVERQSDQWRISGADGTSVLADILILATGHPPASRPPVVDRLSALATSRVKDILAADAFNEIGKCDPVLVVGSGLTAIDALCRLKALDRFTLYFDFTDQRWRYRFDVPELANVPVPEPSARYVTDLRDYGVITHQDAIDFLETEAYDNNLKVIALVHDMNSINNVSSVHDMSRRH
jgi:hypothetical protein